MNNKTAMAALQMQEQAHRTAARLELQAAYVQLLQAQVQKGLITPAEALLLLRGEYREQLVREPTEEDVKFRMKEWAAEELGKFLKPPTPEWIEWIEPKRPVKPAPPFEPEVLSTGKRKIDLSRERDP